MSELDIEKLAALLQGMPPLDENTSAEAAAWLLPRLGAVSRSAEPSAAASWPDPTPEMLADPLFEAIWQRIKHWDISTREPPHGNMYSGATGNHVRAILDALRAVGPRAPEPDQALHAMALYDLECAADELDRPQSEWRWDELRRVRTALEMLRGDPLDRQP